MFGWSRKSEGSDIRSTFELRREQLRQSVLGARRAVGPRVHAASTASVAGLRATGAAVRGAAGAGRRVASLGVRRALNGLAATATTVAGLRSAGAVVRSGARAGGEAIVFAARRTLGGSAAVAGKSWQAARAATGALPRALGRPSIAGIVAAAGALALGVGIGRYRGIGLDSEAVATLAVGAALMAILLPTGLHHLIGRFPALGSPLVITATVAIALLAAAGLWSTYRNTFSLAGIGEGKEVVGRATVVAGDLLKVAGTTVRLSGIEAPERAQFCGKDAGKWRCADVAQSALWRVVGGRPVRCKLRGTDNAGRPLGYCSIDSVDINADLVRQGHVFAEGGTSSRYGAQEKDARDAKAGMWIGDAQRPTEFRAKAWEEAKRRAPDGCPIKGQVTGPDRVYVLPGTPAYERARVQTSRGDRWFCSEQDAASAGFKAAQRG